MEDQLNNYKIDNLQTMLKEVKNLAEQNRRSLDKLNRNVDIMSEKFVGLQRSINELEKRQEKSEEQVGQHSDRLIEYDTSVKTVIKIVAMFGSILGIIQVVGVYVLYQLGLFS